MEVRSVIWPSRSWLEPKFLDRSDVYAFHGYTGSCQSILAGFKSMRVYFPVSDIRRFWLGFGFRYWWIPNSILKSSSLLPRLISDDRSPWRNILLRNLWMLVQTYILWPRIHRMISSLILKHFRPDDASVVIDSWSLCPSATNVNRKHSQRLKNLSPCVLLYSQK